MVVVAIIAVLAAIAIPVIQNTARTTRVTTAANDLQNYFKQFQLYNLENDEFPGQNGFNSIPEEMDGMLSAAWEEGGPVGGSLRWRYTTNNNPIRRQAYIEIRDRRNREPITYSRQQLEEIDAIIDDGDLSSGSFRQQGRHLRYYLKERNQDPN